MSQTGDQAIHQDGSRGSAATSGWLRGPWLFSARVDLSVFLGSAIVALALLPIGAGLGVLHGDSPEWTWVGAVLLIDIAHVWSTTFRVYLDRTELRRRFWLYVLVPVFAWVAGVALYSESKMLFWRVLAYMAVFHFVRQQYGWVALYRSRAGETGRHGRWLDTATIYAATVFPLLYWHAHLPREFWWFLPGDFAAISLDVLTVDVLTAVSTAAEPVYWGLMALYLGRSAYLWLRRGRGNPGKDIVVITTALCWYIGIVALNSDYAFTVTNVIIHGVPYFALIYWYGRKRYRDQASRSTNRAGRRMPGSPALRVFSRGPWLFLAILWLVAYGEELFWDRVVWHDRAWLFGVGWDLETVHLFLVPLLALPQATHYILDGFIWRRRDNPDVARAIAMDG